MADAFGLYTAAHTAILEANSSLASSGASGWRVNGQFAALESAVLALTKAKWYLGSATGIAFGLPSSTDASCDLERSITYFQEAIDLAKATSQATNAGSWATARRQTRLTSEGTEITFVDGVPVVPSICPVVLLQGSFGDMGRQYAAQVHQIFGRWILGPIAGLQLTADDVDCVRNWERELLEHAPEIISFSQGYAEGATAVGVATSYEQALTMWTGRHPPVRGPGGFGFRGLERGTEAAYFGLPFDGELCSGAAAWGEATPDRRLVAAATTDHDCTYQATIVAFPHDGNAFVYTPFSVNGIIPNLGEWYMAGHPGMNARGVAYVHHGGAHCAGDEDGEPGYGIRRGAATVHALAYAESRHEALAQLLSYPAGDYGSILGSANGFYADAGGSLVVETRGQHPRIREHSRSEDGRVYDFLYANNNFLSPDAGECGAPPDGYAFGSVEGWYATSPIDIQGVGAARAARHAMSVSSRVRNRYLFEMLRAGYGHIDVKYVRMMYRHGRGLGRCEDGVPETIGGSAAHRLNAFTVVMRPDAAGNGLYSASVGPANRMLRPNSGHGYFYYDETNQFWDLHLADSPAAVARAAATTARDDAAAAEQAAAQVHPRDPDQDLLQRRLAQARAHLRRGDQSMGVANGGEGRLGAVARATRDFTRAQVRARQAVAMVAPPAERPEDLHPRRVT